MQVTLIRHGQIQANLEKRYAGSTNQDLNENGREQARNARAPEADRLYSSPYKRCLQTAAIMYPDMEPIIVEDLREMCFGIFEGRNADEMVDFKPYRDWVDSMCEGPVPEGESLSEFDARIAPAFKGVIAECRPDDHVSLVVHGGVIMSIMGAFCDEGLQYFDYYIKNCGYYICDVQTEPELKLHRIGGEIPKGSLPSQAEK